MPVHRSRRPAFTLVELIVVIAIIGVLAALTATLLPNFQDTELTNRGADQLQNWLLSAKMQAKRDGLPTGIRLTLMTNPSTGNLDVVQNVDYLQTPNNYAQGIFTGADTDPNPGPTNGFPRARFSLPAGVTFYDTGSGAFVVQPGDYLELFGGGVLHQIQAVPQPPTPAPNPPTENAALILVKDTTMGGLGMPLPWISTTPPPRSSAINYRIIPQPRVLNGEQTMSLPTNIFISFESPDLTNPAFTLSQNFPPAHVVIVNGVPTKVIDILFAPSGAVVGQGTLTGQIILWVRRIDPNVGNQPAITTADLLSGKGTLIAIQPRTGFIAAHPAASGADPYVFIRDGSSSGL